MMEAVSGTANQWRQLLSISKYSVEVEMVPRGPEEDGLDKGKYCHHL